MKIPTLGLKTTIILLVLLTVPTFFSIVRPGFFPMQDDLQAFRIHQMDKCFTDGQFPCRWVPDMGYQYGYPQFNFYPPSVFYAGELLHLLGFQFIDSVKILFGLAFLLSALAMFLLLNEMFGVWPAFVGSLLYSYAPFKAAEVYVRGSISEFWAFVFFPLIFWSIFKLIKTEKLKYIIWLGLFSGLLLLTHNLMSMIFFPIVSVWALALAYTENKWKVLLKAFFGVLMGVVLASFYLLPAILEKPYVHLDTILSGYFDYRQHFVSIYQLFISNYFDYGSSVLGTGDTVTLSTGQVHWIMGLVGVLLAAFNFKKHRKMSILMLILGVAELGTLFMIHERSSFIWERLPILHWLQFPWRFLADSVFLLSILSAGAIYFLYKMGKKNLSIGLGILAIVGVLILHAANFMPQKWLNISDSDKFSGASWEKQLTISIFDYLPIYAKLPPNAKAPETPEALDGQAEFFKYTKGSDYQTGYVDASGSATIRVPLFDFPGMTVLVDGQTVRHINNDCRKEEYCLGLITFNVNDGTHQILVKLQDTPVRTWGNILSIIGLVSVFGILFKIKMHGKNI